MRYLNKFLIGALVVVAVASGITILTYLAVFMPSETILLLGGMAISCFLIPNSDKWQS